MTMKRWAAACGVSAIGALLLACSSEQSASRDEHGAGDTRDLGVAAESAAVTTESAAPERRGCACPRVPACRAKCDPNCVEAGRYLLLGPVVVDMEQAGRMWQRIDAPRLLDYAEAVAYCTHLSEGCYPSGWRLPSATELHSLVYKAGGLEAGRPGYCNPAIDQAAFPGTASDHYWTGDVDEARGEAMWVNFFDGREHTDVVESEKHVRCVHDP